MNPLEFEKIRKRPVPYNAMLFVPSTKKKFTEVQTLVDLHKKEKTPRHQGYSLSDHINCMGHKYRKFTCNDCKFFCYSAVSFRIHSERKMGM